MKKTWESIPPFAKGVVVVVSTAIVAGAIFVSYNSIKRYIADRDSRNEIKDLSDNLVQLAQQNIHPTISQQQASAMANSLHAAFDGYGTDYDTVLRVIKQMANEADAVILLKTYGTRTVSSGKYNPEPDFTGTLAATMPVELSSGEVDEINNILQQRGIAQRF